MKRFYPLLLLLLVVLSGCRTAKQHAPALPAPPEYLSSKVEYCVPMKGDLMKLHGSMKLIRGERIQLSVQTPIIRTEAARVELTPDEALVIDRLGKRYARLSAAQLKSYLSLPKVYRKIEGLALDAAKPGGKSEFTAADFGIDQFPGAGLQLYRFSHDAFQLPATEVSARYHEMTPEELLMLLKKLLHL